MVNDPGTWMEYSAGTSHILSAILTKVSRRNTHQFATEVLAQPIGITLAGWRRDPLGIYFGGNGMLMTAAVERVRRAVSAPRARTRPGCRPGRMGGHILSAAHPVAP